MLEKVEKQSKRDFEFTDKPSEVDILKISNHIDGLSKFLMRCDMPMTVSIQGEWGTGKSSIMKQVMNKIKEDESHNILNIWFDTWQFSQFSFDDQLPIILLNRLVSKIIEEGDFENDGKDEGNKIMDNIKAIGRNVMNTGAFGVNSILKEKLGVNFNELNNHYKENEEAIEEPSKDMYEEVEEFKLKFKEWIDKAKNDRFIIYIDDLDRLVPEKAVELLEVLKIFLDVDKCVFVLAIDYDVVLRGVSAKYGFDMKDSKELVKGKNFFDKIIQVPYTVPLAEYDFEDFITNFLNDEDLIEYDESLDKSVDTYEKLLMNSVGKNPRSVKRILNTFKLNRLIKVLTKEESLILFTFMCMQNAYPLSYSYLINNHDTIENNIKNLVRKKINEKVLNASELVDELEKTENKRFLTKVEDIVRNIDEETLEKVVNVSINTFISRQEKVSRLEEFNDLESLLKYYVEDLGRKITYTIEDIQAIEDKISNLSEELEKEYLGNANINVIKFKTDKYIIAHIILNITSFSVECSIGNKLKDNQTINSIIDKYKMKLTNSNNVNFNIMTLNTPKNPDFIEDLMKIISILIANK